MAKTVKTDEVADTIVNFLMAGLETYTDIMNETIDDIAEGVLDETKRHITWKDKEYSKSFRIATTKQERRRKYKTWYVEAPHYRLTHLLEFGHYKRNGEWGTREFPHVRYGFEFVRDNYERELKERIENARIKDNP